jgi:hypothetical protein
VALAQIETSDDLGLSAGAAMSRAKPTVAPLLGRLLVLSFAVVAAFLLASKGVALVRHYHEIIQAAYEAPGPPKFPFAGDVTVFYTAGEVAVSGQRDHLYDPDYFVPKVFETQGFQKGDPRAGNGAWSKFYNPPFFALLLAPLTLFELHTAYLVVIGVNIAAGVLLVYLMGRILRWRQPATLLLVLGLFSFTPLYFVFQHAQPSLLLALLLAASFLAMEARASRASGVLLVLAGLKPQWLALPALVLLQRDRRALLWWALAGVVVIGLPFVLVGWRGVSDYLSIVLDRGGGDISDQNFSAAILSWSGFLRALTGSPQPLLWALLAAVTLVAFLFILANGDVRLSSAAAIIATLLVVPHSHPQDWVVVAVAAAIALSRDAPVASHLGTCACLLAVYLAGNDWPNESYAVSVGQHAAYWITPAAAALLFWFGVQPAFEARLASLDSPLLGRVRWQSLGGVRVQAWQIAGVMFSLGMVLGVGLAIILLKGNASPQFVLAPPAAPAPAPLQPTLLSGEGADASAGWGVNARASRPQPLAPPDGGTGRADATALEGGGQALAVGSGVVGGQQTAPAAVDLGAEAHTAAAAPAEPDNAEAALAASAPPVQEVEAAKGAPGPAPAVAPRPATSVGMALGPGEAAPVPLELPFTSNSLSASALAGEASVRSEVVAAGTRGVQAGLRAVFVVPLVSSEASLRAVAGMGGTAEPAVWRAAGTRAIAASAASVSRALALAHQRNAASGIPEASATGQVGGQAPAAANAGLQLGDGLADALSGAALALGSRLPVLQSGGLAAHVREAGRAVGLSSGLSDGGAVLAGAGPAGGRGLPRALATLGGTAGDVAAARGRLNSSAPPLASIASATARLGRRAGSLPAALAASGLGRPASAPGPRPGEVQRPGSAAAAAASRLGRFAAMVARQGSDVDAGRRALEGATAAIAAARSGLRTAAGSRLAVVTAIEQDERVRQAAAQVPPTQTPVPVITDRTDCEAIRATGPKTPGERALLQTTCAPTPTPAPPTPEPPTPEAPAPGPQTAVRATAPEPPPPPAKCTRVSVVRAPAVSQLPDGGFRIDAEVAPSEPSGCVEWPAAFSASATLSVTSGSAAYQGTWSCNSANNATAGVPASTHFAFFCTIASRSGPPSGSDSLSVQVTALGPGGEVISVASQSFPVPPVR